VLGNEGAGLGDAANAAVHARIGIPIRGPAESLNVAMAGTVLMYQLTRAVP
jgi:TrmH family RNA methyltransferase